MYHCLTFLILIFIFKMYKIINIFSKSEHSMLLITNLDARCGLSIFTKFFQTILKMLF